MNKIKYQVLEGSQNGNPVTYRLILDPLNLKELYPHRISIFWKYEPRESGLASQQTNNDQNTFEDVLDEIEKTGLGIVALVVFGDGRKEWHWYTKDVTEWFERMNVILKEYPAYPLQIEHNTNDDWAYHLAFKEWTGLV